MRTGDRLDPTLCRVNFRGQVRRFVSHPCAPLGAVAVAYNLPDVAEELRFTGPVHGIRGKT